MPVLIRVAEVLESWPQWGIVLLGGVPIAIIGVLDYLTGAHLTLSAVYLIPVSLVAWAVGGRIAILLSIVTASTSFFAELMTPHMSESILVPIWNAVSRLIVFLFVVALFGHLRGSRVRAEEAAERDFLTGIANSRAFASIAGREIERSRRYGEPFTVAYLDLDNFKSINDRFGHSTGDRVLRRVAEALRANTRVTDMVARLGGDEFAILLSGTNPSDADYVLRLVWERMARAFHDADIVVTYSLGAVTFVTPPASLDAMLRAADDLMYRAKREAKGSYLHALAGTLDAPASYHDDRMTTGNGGDVDVRGT